MTNKPIKPLPYYSTYIDFPEKNLSESLRAAFVGKLKNILPYHHLCGLPPHFLVDFIKSHKSSYPYFLRLDIKKFYPNLRHADITEASQLAYRYLYNLDYIPETVSNECFLPLIQWTRLLPLVDVGIPLGSSMSAIAAPLALLPLWLELKKERNLPITVYSDDVLILCHSRWEMEKVFMHIHNALKTRYDLELNKDKLQSGRFADDVFNFCGWQVAGGYVSINQSKIDGFKSRFEAIVNQQDGRNQKDIIKKLNQSIDGFGNHYKHGDVKSQFRKLDIYVRRQVRPLLFGKKRIVNAEIQATGLRSFTDIHYKHLEKTGRLPSLRPCRTASKHLSERTPVAKADNGDLMVVSMEKMSYTMSEILKTHKLQLSAITKLIDSIRTL